MNGNPLFDRKDEIFFDKVYSEKDFNKDCGWIDKLKNDKLLNEPNLVLLSRFWITELKKEDRKIRKIAKQSIKYMMFLRKSEKQNVVSK